MKNAPKRAYNALTNTKDNLKEYLQYFIDRYIFDYEYKFKKPLKEMDALSSESMEIEKNITDITATIKRLTLEKSSNNADMALNGEKSETIYKANKEYEKRIQDNRDKIERLRKRLRINEERQKKVEII